MGGYDAAERTSTGYVSRDHWEPPGTVGYMRRRSTKKHTLKNGLSCCTMKQRSGNGGGGDDDIKTWRRWRHVSSICRTVAPRRDPLTASPLLATRCLSTINSPTRGGDGRALASLAKRQISLSPTNFLSFLPLRFRSIQSISCLCKVSRRFFLPHRVCS